MKNYNRRDFLKLTGASALALTLAACGGGSSAPAVPSQDAQSLFAAINAYRKEKGLKELKYDNDLEAHVKLDVQCFEAQGKTKITGESQSEWFRSHKDNYDDLMGKLKLKNIEKCDCAWYGFGYLPTELTLTLLYPATEEELKTQLAATATEFGVDYEYIGITLTTIGGKKYWAAMLATTRG